MTRIEEGRTETKLMDHSVYEKTEATQMIMKSQLEWLVQPRTKAFNQYEG